MCKGGLYAAGRSRTRRSKEHGARSCGCILYSCVALGADGVYHEIYALLAGTFVSGLHHDPDHRLSAGLPDQDAARVAQAFSHLGDCGLHRGVVLRLRLGNDTDIFQYLRM